MAYLIFKVCLIAISVALLLTAMIFRLNHKRRIADILELVSYGFLIAFTAQYVSWTNIQAYTNANSISMLLLFIFSVILGIYKMIVIIQRK